MRFKIVCKICKEGFWFTGHGEEDVNATILNDNDRTWDEVCDHIKKGGDYDITDSEYKDDEE